MTEITDRDEPGKRSLLAFFREEPLVHFLALAGLLFVANALVAGDQRETITVTSDAQAFLVRQQEDLLLRPLTSEERQGVIDRFIEEEIFVREARARGFDSSSRIRTLLIQNMRFFLANDIPAADEEEYLRHYDENPGRFRTKERVSYDHVLYRDPDAVPDDTLAVLRSGLDHQGIGDPYTVTAGLAGVDRRQVAAAFGPEIAPAILAISDTEWHGPFVSDEGVHFLRVVTRTESYLPPFEAIQNWVETDWLAFQSRKRVDEALASMRENYNIVVEAEPAGAAE